MFLLEFAVPLPDPFLKLVLCPRSFRPRAPLVVLSRVRIHRTHPSPYAFSYDYYIPTSPNFISLVLVTRHSSLLTRHSSLVTRHLSLVTRHLSLVTRHLSLVTRHSSLVTRHSSLVTRHSSLVTRHSSLVTGSAFAPASRVASSTWNNDRDRRCLEPLTLLLHKSPASTSLLIHSFGFALILV
jgi:hypothetical protein